MDAEHFDALARKLLVTRCRRGLLAGLASGLLAIVPFGLGSEDAAARKKRKRKRRKRRCIPKCAGKVCGDDGCGGVCGVPCAGSATCQAGTCVPFCVGKNACVELSICSNDGPPYCVCFVTVGTGVPFCGLSTLPAACSTCKAWETCVDLSGPVCSGKPGTTGCSQPCPYPR
jgi:hypothetical protein